MKILIVGKTQMKDRECIGAITQTGVSVRLYSDSDYQIGQVWDIDYTPIIDTIPPHTEDVKVNKKVYVGESTVQEQQDVIEKFMSPTIGLPQNLYDGLLQIGNNGREPLYIARQSGVPNYSTTFWRSDSHLTRLTEEEAFGKRYNQDKVRWFYQYQSANVRCTLAFVGFQGPIRIIPEHVLIRVSLARWWKNSNDTEERCYAQLSGWFI